MIQKVYDGKKINGVAGFGAAAGGGGCFWGGCVEALSICSRLWWWRWFNIGFRIQQNISP